MSQEKVISSTLNEHSEEKKNSTAELILANKNLILQIQDNEKRTAELVAANAEIAFQNKEKEKTSR